MCLFFLYFDYANQVKREKFLEIRGIRVLERSLILQPEGHNMKPDLQVSFPQILLEMYVDFAATLYEINQLTRCVLYFLFYAEHLTLKNGPKRHVKSYT